MKRLLVYISVIRISVIRNREFRPENGAKIKSYFSSGPIPLAVTHF